MTKRKKQLMDGYARLNLGAILARIYTQLLRECFSGPKPMQARQVKAVRAEIACADFDAEFRKAALLALVKPKKVFSCKLAKLIALAILSGNAAVFERLDWLMGHFDEFEDPDPDPIDVKLRALAKNHKFKGHRWNIAPLAEYLEYSGNLEVLRRKAVARGVAMQRGRPRKRLPTQGATRVVFCR